MRIYFTGASSFTGYWFCKTLAEAGHEVVAAFTKPSLGSYQHLHRTRCELLLPLVEPIWNASMGSQAMLRKLSTDQFDLLCLHGAIVGNHRAADFPVLEAFRLNTLDLDRILATAKSNGLKGVVHTGTYFEADEGQGTMPLEAFSLYALSKTLTWQLVRYRCFQHGIRLGKFVVANPFGRYEKPGFTTYLIDSWKSGQVPLVKTPDYVRDNVPVDLMALHYQDFCTQVAIPPTGLADAYPVPKSCPTCYVGKNRDFANRLAAECSKVFTISCPIEFVVQSDFSEPMERFSTNNSPDCSRRISDNAKASWSETKFWSDYLASSSALQQGQ